MMILSFDADKEEAWYACIDSIERDTHLYGTGRAWDCGDL